MLDTVLSAIGLAVTSVGFNLVASQAFEKFKLIKRRGLRITYSLGLSVVLAFGVALVVPPWANVVKGWFGLNAPATPTRIDVALAGDIDSRQVDNEDHRYTKNALVRGHHYVDVRLQAKNTGQEEARDLVVHFYVNGNEGQCFQYVPSSLKLYNGSYPSGVDLDTSADDTSVSNLFNHDKGINVGTYREGVNMYLVLRFHIVPECAKETRNFDIGANFAAASSKGTPEVTAWAKITWVPA